MGARQRLLETLRVVAVVGVALSTPTAPLEGQLVPPTERSRARPSVAIGPPTTPGIHLDVREEYYEVTEATLTEVVRQLNRMHLQGPGAPPSQGLTRYHIRPEWTARARGGQCRVQNVAVFVDVTITLPRWPSVFDRPQGEREAWGSIDRAIREHEYAHKDLVVEAAADLLEELSGLRARGCGVLRGVVSSTLAIADQRLDEAHQELDAQSPRRLSIG